MLTAAQLYTNDQVRAILTVSSADLTDKTLELYGLDDDLCIYLDKHIPEWESITDVKHIRLLKVFAKYYCASVTALTAPVFILKKMSDGNNEGQRSDKDGFRWLAEELKAKADEVLADLLEDLGLEVTTNLSLVGISSPARDVITDPRT